MSNFIRDVSARSRDIPLNGLPAVYEDYNYSSGVAYCPGTSTGDEIGFKQHLFNQEPIQQVDTYYNNLYRHTIDQLRTCTETWNDYHNANSVPYYIRDCVSARIDDDAIHGRVNDPDTETFVPDATAFVVEDQVITDRKFVSSLSDKTYSYRLNFTPYLNNTENLVTMTSGHSLKFINGTIHVVSGYQVEPTELDPTGVPDTLTSLQSLITFDIDKAIEVSKLNDNFIIDIAPTVDDEDVYKVDANTPLDPGTIIDTGIPCTQKELYDRGIISGMLFFVDGRPMQWDNVVFTTDDRDTYVTFIIKINALKEEISDDPYIRCVAFPFPVHYIEPGHWNTSKNDLFSWYAGEDNYSNHIRRTTTEHLSSTKYGIVPVQDNVYVEDIIIPFDKLYRSNQTTNPLYYNYVIPMTKLPYENKIKRFNVFTMLFPNSALHDANALGILQEAEDKVKLTWHPFNHLNVRIEKSLIDKVKAYYELKNIPKNGIEFRIFYNKRVTYDQDNALRLWNRARVNEDYETYVSTLESNIKLFIERIYDLAQEPQNCIEMTIAHFDNMEEGSTPTDEFIYYTSEETRTLLHNVAAEMFATDSQEIKDCINGIIDDAFITRFNGDALDEWSLRKNLPEMFAFADNMDLIINNMGLLEEVFDYTYKDYNDYFRDVYESTDYIISYDPDKLESSILHPTFSYTKTGHEVFNMIYNDESNGLTLAVPMANSGKRESHLLLFHDGLLYAKYNTIRYEGLNILFEMNKTTDCQDDDSVWEFVWFRNVNNESVVTTYDNHPDDDFCTRYNSDGDISYTTTGYKYIGCNTDTFDPEDLVVLANIINTNPYKERIKNNTDADFSKTKYPLFYQLYSYEAHHDITAKAIFNFGSDYKLNGLHRITRQGGGEYFIIPKMYNAAGTKSVPYTIPDPNPDRIIFQSNPGLGSHAFAFMKDITQITFNGTSSQFFDIAKDNSYYYELNSDVAVINCSNVDVDFRHPSQE